MRDHLILLCLVWFVVKTFHFGEMKVTNSSENNKMYKICSYYP